MASKRIQRVRRRIMHWVWDGRPEWTWFISDRIIARPLCWIAGHDAVCDHCHKPEHDFCGFCMKVMPGEAHR